MSKLIVIISVLNLTLFNYATGIGNRSQSHLALQFVALEQVDILSNSEHSTNYKSSLSKFALPKIQESSKLPDNCTAVLRSYSESLINFTRCSLMNARPVSFCRNCVEQYSSVVTCYRSLKMGPPECQTSLFSSDELVIVNVMNTNINNLWLKGNCQGCNEVNNETKKLQNNNVTLQFFHIVDEFNKCVLNVTKIMSNGDKEICEQCSSLYLKLNNMYNSFVEKYNGVCMDIVDRMNITRHIWNDQYHCIPSYDVTLGWANILTSLMVGTLPFFFYLLARSVTIIEDVKIVRPKRKNLVPVAPTQN